MAVIFRPANKPAVTIGGTNTTGPFPKYSINREVVSAEDGTILSNKYSIEIAGTIITDANIDISTSGAMQSNLHAKIIEKLQTDIGNGQNIGRLEIVPYGGAPNTIEFSNARLMSINIPEQSEESSGILFSDYSFSFEAYEDISNREPEDSPIVSSAEESWEISIDEEVNYTNNEYTGAPNRTYTITHTVSATGVKRVENDVVIHAWKSAADWVKGRLVSSPASVILTDIGGAAIPTEQTFKPVYFDTEVSNLSTNLSGMNFYNHTRTPQVNISAGSYSVTETWKASDIPATIDMEINLETDENGVTSSTLSGSIVGLDLTSLNNKVISKIENAEPILLTIESGAYALCQSYQADLEPIIRSKSIGRNKATGTITFSYSYNNIPVLLEGAISTNVTITDDNEYRLAQIIAIIPIIAKPDGPVIQNMYTTPERKRSVQIDAVMNKANRISKPTAGVALALGYAPSNSYVQAISENWEPNTGTYSISVEWVY